MTESEAREVLPGSGDLMELVFETCDEFKTKSVDEIDDTKTEFGQKLLQRVVDWMVENA